MSLVAGCSGQLLEETIDTAEFNAPRPCNEPMKLFNTFSVFAKRTSWKASPGDPSSTLKVELSINNDKGWPIALSNSTHGVLYTIDFVLRGEKNNFTPKEKTGILLAHEAKEFKEPKRSGPFAKPTRSSSSSRGKKIDDNARDVNFRIKPGTPEEGTLVFQAPRDRYLLVIERKYAGQQPSAQTKDHVAVCRISPIDISGQAKEIGDDGVKKSAG